MKFFKRALAVVMIALMLLPLGIVSSFAEDLEDNWTTMGAKYSSSTYSILLNKEGEVRSEGFDFAANEKGGIHVRIPDYATFGGVFGTGVLSSNSAVTLDGLTVSLSADESFVFAKDNKGLTASVSLIWSEDQITDIKKLDNAEVIATNGLRMLSPNTGHEIAIILSNSKEWKDPNDLTGNTVKNVTYASNLSIVLFKDSWIDSTSNKYPGYRWTFTSRNNPDDPNSPGDYSQIKQNYERVDVAELTYEFRTDTTLGYRVTVNGKEYYEGSKVAFFPENTGELKDIDYQRVSDKYIQSMTYAKDDIDLSSLVGAEGHLAVGMSQNYNRFETGFTLDTVNGVPAAQWSGQTLGEHVHSYSAETVDMTCTSDGYTVYTCSCGAHYRVPDVTKGHRWVVVSETPAGCLEPGKQAKRCSYCGETTEVLTPATGHTFVDYGFPMRDNGPFRAEWEVTTPATPEADGVMSRTCNKCGETETKSYQYSDADKIADNWFVSGENRAYSLIAENRGKQAIFTTLNEDGSITLEDAVSHEEDGICSYNISKITSKHTSELNGFTAVVEMLPASELSERRATSISFMWTNQYDNYRFAGQYSSGLYLYYREVTRSGADEVDYDDPTYISKPAGRPLGASSMEDSRAGYAWSYYVPLEEYSFSLTLLDYMSVFGSTYGVKDDNMYDVATYAVVCRGDFWDLQHEMIEPVDATEPIEVMSEYFYDEYAGGDVLCYLINEEEYFTRGIPECMTYQKEFYFSVAAYADGVDLTDRAHGASFTLLSVCGVPAAEFDGYVDPYACEHEWSEYEYEKDPITGEDYSARENCIHVGKKVRTCALCGASEYISIPKSEHKFDIDHPQWVKEPTCVEKGIAWYYCNAVCDYKTGATHGPSDKYYVPATGIHDWSEWEVIEEPTCKEGKRAHHCTYCGLEETEVIPATGDHEWSEEWIVDTAPTYDRAGHQYKVCSVCGEIMGEDIEMLVLPENVFTDVKEGKWYTKGVLACYGRGYMNGVTETTFEPGANLTRAMFVTILSKVDGADLSGYAKDTEGLPFTDVKAGYYIRALKWAYEKGYTSGITATTFGPNDNVTREQLATFLYTYAEKNGFNVSASKDITGYEDYSRVAKYARKALSWAVGADMVSGTSATTLSPKDPATRGQVALIITKFVDNIVLEPKPIPGA